ncbi:RXLR78 [Symbiodinium pilosum]|uniref:RXLR78 protein n=1 Tax=Symbiodinium pilosum TaxID=2952 RepID=A0A812IT85_SYMPI|nr:RXLR78 [Symbiodinium pilosum]
MKVAPFTGEGPSHCRNQGEAGNFGLFEYFPGIQVIWGLSNGEATAAPSKADGVVVLLSPRIDSGQIRWREHRVGRLLEVRFVHAGCPFVALNAYQHVWSSAKTPQQNRKDRSSFLASLNKAVRQVPSRTSLVVAGATLSPSPRLVGPRTCGAAPRPDSESLQELVETHKLVALNTWHAAIPHTHTQQGSHSQIDFVFTKEPQAGGQAKRSAPLHDWHLGSWKVGGHSPVFAAVKPLGHWQLPLRKDVSTCDVKQLQAEVREGSDRAKQMRDWVRARMPVQHPDQCNQILTAAAELFFPRRVRSSQRPLDSRRMWQLAREVKSSPNPDPARLAELEASQEQHRQQVRQRQKERAAKFLEGVDEAIAEGSSHVAYSTLKQLRPWQPQQRAQLKNRDGRLMGVAEELEVLGEFASSIFGAHAPLPDRTGSLPHLDPQLLAKHIRSIKPHKAVPKGSAPAAAWKLCANEVSPSISAFLATVGEERLPSGLLDADLCLIPKPGKPADKPSNLRPLGILRPDAKGVAGAARELLSPGLQSYMREVPQFAYLPGRGLSDAHARLIRHLREVRQLCGTASPGRQELREGALRPDLVGGLTFALDLSQACDTVSRQEIIATLPALTDDPALVSLVHALHHRSAYKLAAQGEVTEVETTTGIKQGCKLAPSLFSLLTGKLIKELIEVFGEDRVCAFLTGYADDLTVHRTIRSVVDVEACHALIRAVVESLKDHKLVCNQSKCFILAKFAGRQAASVTKQYTAWTRNEAGERIKLWRIGKTKHFPALRWVPTIKFLGIKASYGPFEMQTLTFRISEAKQKLHQVGLSLESAKSLKAWYAFKIRSLLNKPAHLYDLYSIEDPEQLANLRQFKHLPETEAAEGTPVISCQDCDRSFVSEQGLRLHRSVHYYCSLVIGKSAQQEKAAASNQEPPAPSRRQENTSCRPAVRQGFASYPA